METQGRSVGRQELILPLESQETKAIWAASSHEDARISWKGKKKTLQGYWGWSGRVIVKQLKWSRFLRDLECKGQEFRKSCRGSHMGELVKIIKQVSSSSLNVTETSQWHKTSSSRGHARFLLTLLLLDVFKKINSSFLLPRSLNIRLENSICGMCKCLDTLPRGNIHPHFFVRRYTAWLNVYKHLTFTPICGSLLQAYNCTECLCIVSFDWNQMAHTCVTMHPVLHEYIVCQGCIGKKPTVLNKALDRNPAEHFWGWIETQTAPQASSLDITELTNAVVTRDE